MQELATAPRADIDRADERRHLDRSFLHGVAWTGGITWGGQLLAWLSTLIVIRLLKPADYGIVGMATLYLGLIQLLSEFGVGAAVVKFRDLTREQIAQLNTVAVGLGLAGFLATCAAALPLGRFFGVPRLPIVVVVISAGFVISAFSVIPQSLLTKEMRFKQLSLFGGAQVIATALCTVTLALLGFGYWALVAGNLVGVLVLTSLILSARRHPYGLPDFDSLRSAVTFSGNVLAARVAWYVYSNADFLVVGKLLGQAALGTYTVAWSLATLVVDKISAVVGQVTPGVFSATQKDLPELRRYLLQVTEALALITFPAALGLTVVAPEFVHVVLGAKWTGIIVPLQLLGCYGTLRSLTVFLPQVLNAVGDSAFPMKLAIAAAIVLPAAFYIGSRYGTTGVALAWLVAYPLTTIPLYRRVFARIELDGRDYVRALLPGLSSSCVMLLVIIVLGELLPVELAHATRLAVKVAVGVLAYVMAVLTLHRDRVGAMYTRIRTLRLSGA